MKKNIFLGILSMGILAQNQLAAEEQPLALKNAQALELVGAINKNPVEFALNEPMEFSFTLECKEGAVTNNFDVVVRRRGDDGISETKRFPIKVGETIKYTTSIAVPGFVDVRAHVEGEGNIRLKKKVEYWGGKHTYDVLSPMGAGAAISELKQAVPEPADFDEYWAKEKAKLDDVPVKAEMVLVKTNSVGKLVYEVKVDSPTERPVTGYLLIEPNAKPGTLSATVDFQGYGCGKQWIQEWQTDKITFSINAHGFDLGKDNQYYAEFNKSIMSNGHGYAMDPEQNSDRDTAYFHDMLLRVLRALEFVKTLPEWDGKNLTVSGGSQGGLQSVWAAAHDSDVSKCRIGIVWCCDIGSQTVPNVLRSWHPQWVEALGYYDAVNHAKRINCPVEFDRIGLGDYTCSPHSNAVLYNSLNVPVKAKWATGSEHGYIAPWAKYYETNRE
jgi:cephalosporin-C deacetylase-like acetyl esterase